ncbi:hypothetical protein [Roseomonas sp. BN140053]|uniref:hypothetical protein n=1 Tax=Roseomonas sp. BN140053 TaxID=3391898 RepID=UPI0039E75E10
MTDAPRPPRPPAEFIDDPHAPKLYATGVSGLWLHAGTVHLTLEVGRVAHDATPGRRQRVVVGTVVMPVAAAQTLAVGLFDFLRSHGVTAALPPAAGPAAPPTSDRMQ